MDVKQWVDHLNTSDFASLADAVHQRQCRERNKLASEFVFDDYDLETIAILRDNNGPDVFRLEMMKHLRTKYKMTLMLAKAVVDIKLRTP